jgi:hypothetical protein
MSSLAADSEYASRKIEQEDWTVLGTTTGVTRWFTKVATRSRAARKSYPIHRRSETGARHVQEPECVTIEDRET